MASSRSTRKSSNTSSASSKGKSKGKQKIASPKVKEGKQLEQKLRNFSESISSPERLQSILSETEEELSSLQPQIDALEERLQELVSLKQTKQKLITLKLSIQSILQNFLEPSRGEERMIPLPMGSGTSSIAPPPSFSTDETTPTAYQDLMFLPDEALKEAEQFLSRKNSINGDILRAIVYQGGMASTQSIKRYLVEQQIQQPNTGKTFENVPLTDISSRTNYLVRKGLLEATGDGRFICKLGWKKPDSLV